MYGMINQAIKEMVIEVFDEFTWSSICEKVELKEKNFDSFFQYDDAITTKLIGEICRKSGMESAVLLESFGMYWIKYAQKSEYSSILDGLASSPLELIDALDSLHTRLEITFDNLSAPSFWTSNKTETSVDVYYKSKRKLGLEPFVVGLLKGIFNLFNEKCEVKILQLQANEIAIFRVNFSNESNT